MIIFLHIPKTGGTSFRKGLQFPVKLSGFSCPRPMFDLIEQKEKMQLSDFFVHGHMNYGVHRIFENPNPKYITILRNPIDRWISFLRYSLKSSLGSAIHRAYTESSGEIDFLERCKNESINCNSMVRQLCGCEPKDVLPKEVIENISGPVWFRPRFCYTSRPYSDNEWEKLLEVAKQNLKSMAYVSFTEQSETDFPRMAETVSLPWKNPKEHSRVSQINCPIDVSNSSVMSMIEGMNKYDIELYDFARSLRV